MAKRYFSVAEARSLLPTVRKLADRMVGISSELEGYGKVAQALAEHRPYDAGSPAGTNYILLLVALRSQVTRLQELGCLVKGVQEGLIDFPHVREGREVYLCWKLGEEDITYWHEVDSGFAGRSPLLDSGENS